MGNITVHGERRRCGNCCSGVDGICTNLVQTEFNPNDVCDQHETQEEFDADVKAIALFRTRIGLPDKPPPDLGDDDDDDDDWRPKTRPKTPAPQQS